jgi:hypothetical protein
MSHLTDLPGTAGLPGLIIPHVWPDAVVMDRPWPLELAPGACLSLPGILATLLFWLLACALLLWTAHRTATVAAGAARSGLDEAMAEAQMALSLGSREDIESSIQEALRRINSPAGLARSALLGRLPLSVSAALSEEAALESCGLAPLERARALREVLVAAVERLQPPRDAQVGYSPAGLQYHILQEEYLQGLPNKQIMVRHGISEGTFHRNRREAIRILAADLCWREGELARQRIGAY